MIKNNILHIRWVSLRYIGVIEENKTVHNHPDCPYIKIGIDRANSARVTLLNLAFISINCSKINFRL